jgi:hypothetical protein
VDEDKYQHYIDDIASRLEDNFPDASSMIFNFRQEEEQGRRSWLSDMISRSSYVMTVMDYPMQYQGCPLLTLEMIHAILRIGDTWLGLDEDNFLILHCERGGWPVLASTPAPLRSSSSSREAAVTPPPRSSSSSPPHLGLPPLSSRSSLSLISL